MTYLEVVNSVLKRLRESTVSTVTENAYSALVGEFVNDAKREVEDAYQWSTLLDYVDITTAPGVATYFLNDSTTGVRNAAITERARLWIDPDENSPLALITDSTRETRLHHISPTESYLYLQQANNQGAQYRPEQFKIKTIPTLVSGKWNKQLELAPTPDDAYTVRLFIVNPQNDLSAASDVLRVPQSPVIQRAYLYCLYERGEELGETLTLTSVKAKESLDTAIALDQQVTTQEMAFTVA